MNKLPSDPRLPNANDPLTRRLYEVFRNISIAHNESYFWETNGTSAPSGGTWAVGDKCRNNSPSELGGAGNKYLIIGWCCVTSGTPGTGLETAFNPRVKKSVEWFSETPELASTYGKNIVTKEPAKSIDVADLGFRDYMTEVKQDNVLDRVKRAVVENFQAGRIDKNKAMSINDKIEDMRGSSNEYRRAHEFINTTEVASILKESGYDAISHVENGHQTFGFLNPAANPLDSYDVPVDQLIIRGGLLK